MTKKVKSSAVGKPRDILGYDLIVPCTALAMQIARNAGLQDDIAFVKKLADGFYAVEMKRYSNNYSKKISSKSP